jgi:Uma2 family endonuclease
MTQKATDYLLAGVSRVWVVDTKAQSVTVFSTDELPQTILSDRTITDILFPQLSLPVASLFAQTTE